MLFDEATARRRAAGQSEMGSGPFDQVALAAGDGQTEENQARKAGVGGRLGFGTRVLVSECEGGVGIEHTIYEFVYTKAAVKSIDVISRAEGALLCSKHVIVEATDAHAAYGVKSNIVEIAGNASDKLDRAIDYSIVGKDEQRIVIIGGEAQVRQVVLGDVVSEGNRSGPGDFNTAYRKIPSSRAKKFGKISIGESRRGQQQ